MAGVLFALEVVLGTFTVAALTPVNVASVLGAVVFRVCLGGTPSIDVSTHFELASAPQLVFYGLPAGSTAAPLAAMERMSIRGLDFMSVVESAGDQRLVGLLLRHLSIYPPGYMMESL